MFDYTHLINSEKQLPINIFFNNLIILLPCT